MSSVWRRWVLQSTGKAAIDVDNGPLDIAGRCTRQIGDEISDLARLAETADAHTIGHPTLCLFRRHPIFLGQSVDSSSQSVGANRARIDRIHPNPVVNPSIREALRQIQ